MAQQEASQVSSQAVAPDGNTDLAERAQQAQTTGLGDATRIEKRGDGSGVVIDKGSSLPIFIRRNAAWRPAEQFVHCGSGRECQALLPPDWCAVPSRMD